MNFIKRNALYFALNILTIALVVTLLIESMPIEVIDELGRSTYFTFLTFITTISATLFITYNIIKNKSFTSKENLFYLIFNGTFGLIFLGSSIALFYYAAIGSNQFNLTSSSICLIISAIYLIEQITIHSLNVHKIRKLQKAN